MAFWKSADLEPKRAFRFLVRVGGLSDGSGQFYAKSVTKPAVTVGATPHKFLNHTFYYPGQVTWNECTITLIDPTNPDATHDLLQILRRSGYQIPNSVLNREELSTLSKAESVRSLDGITIDGLNTEGIPLERWRLNNPFITNVSFNDYSYESEELASITVTIRYDWASYEVLGPDARSRAQSPAGDNNPLFN
jgi:hypothetical protein